MLRGDDRGNDPDAGAEEQLNANNALSQAGVDRINGLREMLDYLVELPPEEGDLEAAIAFNAGNILLGGGGSDVIEGRGGDDYIDGAHWLNVRISIRDDAGNEIGTADGMTKVITGKSGILANTADSLTLDQAMFSRLLNPGQLHIVREILYSKDENDIDTAVYFGLADEYDIFENFDGTTVSHTRFAGGGGTVTTFDPLDPDGLNTTRKIVSDGTDTLRNIDRVQFADQVVWLIDRPAEGSVAISNMAPAEDGCCWLPPPSAIPMAPSSPCSATPGRRWWPARGCRSVRGRVSPRRCRGRAGAARCGQLQR